jgi:predicted porin
MDTGAAGATAAVSTLGGGANAINIVTLEDLGGGMRAGFDSQMRFNAATGDRNSAGTGNALLHGANVYVGGGFGTVRVGKIIEASNCAFDPWACTGGAGMAAGHSTAAGHASTSLSALIAAGTIANSVSYQTPTIGGFSANFHTSVSNASRVNERSVMNLTYAAGPLSAQYLQSKGSANVGADGGAAITDVKGQGTSIAAGYDLGVVKLNVINAVTENAAGAKVADITAISGSMPMGAYTLLAGYIKAKTGGTYTATTAADTKLAIGANYALSKRTTLGADLFKSEAVGGSTGFVVRARHNF